MDDASRPVRPLPERHRNKVFPRLWRVTGRDFEAIRAQCHSIRIAVLERHIEYLDFVAGLVYLRRRAAISRSQCLSALVELVRRMNIDASSCSSVEALTSLLVTEFRKFPHRLRNPPVRL